MYYQVLDVRTICMFNILPALWRNTISYIFYPLVFIKHISLLMKLTMLHSIGTILCGVFFTSGALIDDVNRVCECRAVWNGKIIGNRWVAYTRANKNWLTKLELLVMLMSENVSLRNDKEESKSVSLLNTNPILSWIIIRLNLACTKKSSNVDVFTNDRDKNKNSRYFNPYVRI